MKTLVLILAMGISSYSNAWYCKSYGTDGAMGWGRSPDYSTAWRIALANCRSRSFGYCYPPDCE